MFSSIGHRRDTSRFTKRATRRKSFYENVFLGAACGRFHDSRGRVMGVLVVLSDSEKGRCVEILDIGSSFRKFEFSAIFMPERKL